MTPPTLASVRDAVQEIAKRGMITPHQLAAFSQLDEDLNVEQRQRFTSLWRSQGSPAVAPPAPATPSAANPPGTVTLPNFPWFPQLDNGPEGWRQCQTSALAMCLRFLKTPRINDDRDYLAVVERFGDTTDQTSHAAALKQLGVRARFVTNCSAEQLRAELRGGLPAAIGILHHGPVTAPTGGGHWIAVHGYTPDAWIVNDPYGELDLINGSWVRQDTTSGRNQHYSCRNLNPRWLVEGPISGWAWLFS